MAMDAYFTHKYSKDTKSKAKARCPGVSKKQVTRTTTLPVDDIDVTSEEFVVGGKYRLERKLGSGSFGVIYLGVDINTGQKYAVKLERQNARHPQLLLESKFYKSVKGRKKKPKGIPISEYYGEVGTYNVLVMELLGPSLLSLFTFCGRRFSLKTVLMLGLQLIDRMSFLHRKKYIHRDIKPENFVMGTGEHKNRVYTIDFGLCKKYKSSKPLNRHMKMTYGNGLTGTAMYVSLNVHMGYEPSRRDDMESLGYLMVYFLVGSLPWQGIKAKTKEKKLERMFKIKCSVSVERLCEGLPDEFSMYLNYCRSLRFDEKPDYGYLRYLLKLVFRRYKYKYDCMFDWGILLGNTPGGDGQPPHLHPYLK